MTDRDFFRGRLAVVTGADSGIGLCFCRRLAEYGCDLVMISNREKELPECAAMIGRQFGVKTFPCCIDLCSEDVVKRLDSFLESRALDPDILINNAGIFSFNPVTDTPERKIECFIDLHVRAVVLLSRAFAARFADKGEGWILNMSSMSCWMPVPGIAMYSATKSFIRVFSRSLHYETRDSGVRVTVATPGGIATDLFGLPDNLKRLALNLRAIDTPEKFVRGALKSLRRGKAQYINGFLNRIAIVAVGVTPTSVRMLVKRKMLDKGIRRP